MNFFVEHSLLNTLVMTVIIAGGAAFLAGRALATKWRSLWMAVAYMVPLALALRFFHYALFSGSLLTLHYFLVDFVVLVAAVLLGYRTMRVKQMTGQYPWLYERSGPLSWRARKS